MKTAGLRGRGQTLEEESSEQQSEKWCKLDNRPRCHCGLYNIYSVGVVLVRRLSVCVCLCVFM